MATKLLLILAALCCCFVLTNTSRSFQKKLLEKAANDYGFESSEEDEKSSWEFRTKQVKQLGTKFDYRVLSICVNETNDWLYQEDGETCKHRVATGRYSNQVNQTGWGILEVETFDTVEPEIQAYAAGAVEGILTKLQIHYHYINTVQNMCNGQPQQQEYCRKLFSYLTKNMEWIKTQVLIQPKSDIYWRQVNLTYTQLTGIFDGYMNKKLRPAVSFEITNVLKLQLSGELFDLEKFLKKNASVNDEAGKCSGFVKITEGNKDLLMSHVSMSGYNTMNRLLKLYKFAYDKTNVPGHTYSFSGYAGVMASADDYTLVSSGLLSIETTIAVFNMSLYTEEYIKPSQLHCWVRSTVANQLARTAREWTEIFAKYNSGTYNNQWTVLDYKQFTPGKELPNNDVLWVLEQVPGYTLSKDITWFLRKYRYWPSYNIPYLTKISKMSMFDTKAQENDWYSWGSAPRAKMFYRDHHKVVDIDTLRALMRYNDYKHDELSRCACNPPYTAEASISTRGDLNDPNGTYPIAGMGHRNHGSLDYKGTNYELFKQLRFEAVGGPTYGGSGSIPPFDWRTTDIKANHYGQPNLWKFDPITPEWQSSVSVDL